MSKRKIGIGRNIFQDTCDLVYFLIVANNSFTHSRLPVGKIFFCQLTRNSDITGISKRCSRVASQPGKIKETEELWFCEIEALQEFFSWRRIISWYRYLVIDRLRDSRNLFHLRKIYSQCRYHRKWCSG